MSMEDKRFPIISFISLSCPGVELTHDKVHLCMEFLLRSHHPNLIVIAVQERYIQPLVLREKGFIWGSSCPFSCGLKLDVVGFLLTLGGHS